jgi:hypothetical protein
VCVCVYVCACVCMSVTLCVRVCVDTRLGSPVSSDDADHFESAGDKSIALVLAHLCRYHHV